MMKATTHHQPHDKVDGDADKDASGKQQAATHVEKHCCSS
jgi:hypothetical protein